jgi:nucleoside-diphosphate-sugar epimerase
MQNILVTGGAGNVASALVHKLSKNKNYFIVIIDNLSTGSLHKIPKVENGNYISEIDTTFALYRPENLFNKRSNFFKAIRTKVPYIARHGGWYIDSQNLNAE